MPAPLIVSLDSIRTDGWFERIGEGIGSFQALCDIVGPRFFAFAMITGARITSLTVDRRNPDNTLVDFVVGPETAEVSEADAQRLSGQYVDGRAPQPGSPESRDQAKIRRAIEVANILLDRVLPSVPKSDPPPLQPAPDSAR